MRQRPSFVMGFFLLLVLLIRVVNKSILSQAKPPLNGAFVPFALKSKTHNGSTCVLLTIESTLDLNINLPLRVFMD